MTSATFERVELVLATRPIPKLLTTKVLVAALVRTDRPLVYPADAPAVWRIFAEIAGVSGLRLLAPL